MKRNQKVIRAGNSAAVTIPAYFLVEAGVRIGDKVLVKASSRQGKITYCFSPIRQLSLIDQLNKKGK